MYSPTTRSLQLGVLTSAQVGRLPLSVGGSKSRSQNAVTRQWRGWNKNAGRQGYGYSFLKDIALRCSRTDECEVHMDEAYGFHPEKYKCNVFRFNKQYLEKSIFSRPLHLHHWSSRGLEAGKPQLHVGYANSIATNVYCTL